jgi:CHAD domain-containing protein
VKARKLKGLKPDESLRSNAARIVATRLDEMRGLAPEALEPGAETAQHNTRIAAKRLRYVLEIAEGCLGAGAAEARISVKELQSVLGEIHDCDGLLAQVEGIRSLEALLRTRRELLFARFRELWKAEEATFEKLGRVCVDEEKKATIA